MGFLLWILRLCLLLLYHSILISCLGNDTDRLSLLIFKEGVTQDPHQVMSSWNDSSHFCKWMGVTCNLRHHQRVVGLDLGNHKLSGIISPSIGNLSFLTRINLSSNYFNGNIPQEFGHLSRLQQLDLSINSLGGEIPNNLSKCLNLKSLNTSQNQLTGSIPFQLSSLKNLQILILGDNNLTGVIPPWIGNFSSLRKISLTQNTLHGSIPNELGQLSQLEYISVSLNFLSGVIPPSLYNITSIYTFNVVLNELHGTIPGNVGQTLPNLKQLMVGGNRFHGPIPFSLSNALGLRLLEFSTSGFTGPIPMNLGSLQNLTLLNFGDNNLGSGREGDLNFITSLSNCSLLEHLYLYNTNLGGILPESIGNLSIHLQDFSIWRNLIHGHLPTSIENLVGLTRFVFYENLMSGSIPSSMGKLRNLNRLDLSSNKLSGTIPSSLGNLTHLFDLYMEDNRLEGTIPQSLGNLKVLFHFSISSNKLSGAIPEQLFTLSSLFLFDVANNSLSGSLSLNVGRLVNVEELVLSFNNLSGEIPNTIASCFKLEYLHMENNFFHGTIPQSFKALKPLQSLRLSHNNLTGEIPEFLIHAPFLEYLDLSYNDLDGEVPKEGIFRNATAISVRGNKKLCGGIKELGMPTCNEEEVERSRHLLPPRTIIIIAFGVLSFILVAISCAAYWWFKTSRKENTPSTPSTLEKWKSGASYLEIFHSTNGFSLDRLIGTGSFGSVYKGLLSDEETYVAIKVLNLQQKGASKSFIAECEALKNMRHRNLIKVVTVCSSIDFQGNDFKALVFEFMPNGSLEQWLHSNHTNHQQHPRALSFVQRVNIAIDVAFGLEYLHHSYGETIVHCDVKPSNVLLDTDMVAHVGDFGLARFLFNTADDQSEAQTLSSGLKGSIGYIPLEYGVGGEVSTSGDMYSYGILLLEMFTGKKPTDEMFKDGLSLYELVASALSDRVLEIVDLSLFSETLEEEDENGELGNVNESEEAPALSRRTTEWKKGECLVSILTIALSCCAPSPKDRAVASDVVKKMISIRDLFMRTP